MRNFVQSKQCKRKMILSYFDHDVPYKPNPAHVCCDFCRSNCICDVCARAIPGIVQEQPEAAHLPQGQSGEELTKDTLINDEVRPTMKLDLIRYRLNLQQELGRSPVGGVGLSSGFPIELIDLVMQHLTQLSSVEKVKTISPIYSHEIASEIFFIIQENSSGNMDKDVNP